MKKTTGIVIFVLLLSSLCPGYSQSVGLVLSGGGAKGLAHIGVIKALEEYEIPIDYITGTSAGAIVGGLYAAGYTVDEMIEIFKSGMVDDYLKFGEEYSAGYLSKKLPETPSWFTAKFNVDKKLHFTFLRPGFLSTNELDIGIVEFFAQATQACGGNFDSLMVPFRCVASSINENKPYYFSKGDLSVAVRSSMAFPFVFSPVVYDGKVLLDGGMFENFPINVMQQDFNPDYIIGSAVSTNYQPSQGDNIISIMQNVFMVDMDLNAPDNGVVIKPGVTNASLFDFSNVEPLVDSGYYACIEKIPEILDNINRATRAQHRADIRNKFNNKKPPLFFDNIIVDNLNYEQNQYVEMMMARQHKLLSAKEINDNYSLLLSDDMISSIIPHAEYNNYTGNFDLHLNIRKNMNFQTSIGGIMSIGGPSEAYLGFLARGLKRYSYRTAVDATIGTFYQSLNLNLRIDYPASTLLYADADIGLNHKDFRETTFSLFNRKNPSFLLQFESHAMITAGMSLSRRSDLKLKMAYFYTHNDFYNTEAFANNDTADVSIFNAGIFGVAYTYDNLNDPMFPTSGRRIKAKFDNILGAEKYDAGTTSLHKSFKHNQREWFTINVSYEEYIKFSKLFSLGLKTEGQVSDQQLWVNYTSSLLSATPFEPFSDAKIRFMESNRAFNYFAIGGKLIFSLPYNLMISSEGYAFVPFRKITQGPDQIVSFGKLYEKTNYMASLSFVFNNRIAPISLNINFYDEKKLPVTVTFNIGYMFFNKYAL